MPNPYKQPESALSANASPRHRLHRLLIANARLAWIGWLVAAVVLAIPLYHDVIASGSVEAGILAFCVELAVLLTAWILKNRVQRLHAFAKLMTVLLGITCLFRSLGLVFGLFVSIKFMTSGLFFIGLLFILLGWGFFLLSWQDVSALKNGATVQE